MTKIVEQQAQADQVSDAAARQRRERAEAGESVIGRIPAGPHRLAEALAHLDREVARQQAKLEHRAAIIAAGKKPMGAPPVPVEEHSSVIRARRAVEAALVAEDANTSPASSRRSQATKLPRTVANITDPSSRLMPTRRGFLQGYNAQVAVTSDQIIAAVQVGQSPNDMTAFKPMMSAAEAAARNLYEVTGRPDHTIGVVLADAGYCSDANLASPGPDRLIAISKNRDQLKTARELPLTGPPWAGATPRQAMEHRLRTVEGVALYKRRGATVERDSVGQAFQAVADQEEHIRHAAVAELGQHDHPKLCRLPATASRVANKVGTSTPLRAGR